MRRTLALLLTIAPFVAGLVAAMSVRRDMRMLWMAVAVTLIAWAVLRLMSGRARRSTAVTLAFATATLGGVAVALVLGAHAVFGIVAVAVVLAAFATAGAALNDLAQPGDRVNPR